MDLKKLLRGWNLSLRVLGAFLFVALFLSIQFSSQSIAGIEITLILLGLSAAGVILYWPKHHFFPSAGVTIFMIAMIVSTISLVINSVSFWKNAACVNIFAVYWGACSLARALPNKLVLRLVQAVCMTALLVTIYQVVISFGDTTTYGENHPDFGWAMYGTTLPGQCVYLALWTFMFLPQKQNSRFRFVPFYVVFVLNCIFAVLFNIRLMVPMLVIAAGWLWFFSSNIKTFCLRSGLLLAVMGSILFIPSPFTNNTISERMKTVVKDGGSGRSELYNIATAQFDKKDISSLVVGRGASYSVELTKGRDMHNIYLETFYSFGLLGLMGLVIIAISILYNEWKRGFKYPLGATLIAYLIVGFVIFGFKEPAIWFLLGTYEACNKTQTDPACLTDDLKQSVT